MYVSEVQSVQEGGGAMGGIILNMLRTVGEGGGCISSR